MARPGQVEPGMARHGGARRGLTQRVALSLRVLCGAKASQGRARQGMALRGTAWHGKGYNVAVCRFVESAFWCESAKKAGLGKARQGLVWQIPARQGLISAVGIRFGCPPVHSASPGEARLGEARLGTAWWGTARAVYSGQAVYIAVFPVHPASPQRTVQRIRRNAHAADNKE